MNQKFEKGLSCLSVLCVAVGCWGRLPLSEGSFGLVSSMGHSLMAAAAGCQPGVLLAPPAPSCGLFMCLGCLDFGVETPQEETLQDTKAETARFLLT